MSSKCPDVNLEAFVRSSADHYPSLAVELVAKYSGSRCRCTAVDAKSSPPNGEAPVLCKGDQKFSQPGAIIKVLAEESPCASTLLGASPSEKSEVEQGIAFWENAGFCFKNAKDLEEMNQWLSSRAFYAANHITVADLVLYVGCHFLMAKKDASVIGTYCHVARWFDHIQHLPHLNTCIPRLPLVDLTSIFQTIQRSSSSSSAAAAASQPAKGDATGQQSSPGSVRPSQEEVEARRAEKAKAKLEKKEIKGGDKAEGGEGGKKKEKKEQPPERPVADVTRLDCRVGQIKKVWRHPDADKLYCEEIDIGEPEYRKIASGLVDFVEISAMQDARVIVLANLKPKALKGFSSHGMVMCASSPDKSKVEILVPPSAAKIGDRVIWEGLEGEPDAQLNDKKNPFSKVQPDFKTDKDKVAFYKEHRWTINGQPVTTPTITGGTIS